MRFLKRVNNSIAGIRLLITQKLFALNLIRYQCWHQRFGLVSLDQQSPESRFILGWSRTDLTLCRPWFAVTADTFHSAQIDHLHVILHMIIFSLNSIPHSLHVERSDALPPVVWWRPIFLTQLTKNLGRDSDAGFLGGFVTPSLGGELELKSNFEGTRSVRK